MNHSGPKKSSLIFEGLTDVSIITSEFIPWENVFVFFNFFIVYRRQIIVGMDWFIDYGTTPFQGPTAAQKDLSPWTIQICTIIIITIQTRVMLKEFIITDMFTNPNITHITNNSLNHNSITIIAYKITCMFQMFDFTNTNLFLYNFIRCFLPWSSFYLAFVKRIFM